jgi:hypothetical protein
MMRSGVVLDDAFYTLGNGDDIPPLLDDITPRVIINAEEEFLQTGVDSTGLLTNR